MKIKPQWVDSASPATMKSHPSKPRWRRWLVTSALGISLMGAAFNAQASTGTYNVTNTNTFTAASSPLGGIAGCGITPGSHPYASQEFAVPANGTYTLETTSSTMLYLGQPDTYIAVYGVAFDPANPTNGLVACNDDFGTGYLSQITPSLVTGTTYTLVVTAYDPDLTGTVAMSFTPDVTFGAATGAAGSVACTSAATGDWSVPATWDCGHIPTAIDSATIAAGHTVTVDTSAVAETLNLAATATLNFTASNTLNVGAGGIQNSGTITATNAGVITVAATNVVTHAIWNKAGATFTAGAAAINTTATQGIGLENDGAFTSGAGLITAKNFRNGYGNGTAVPTASFTVGAGGVTVTPAEFIPIDGAIILNGNLTIGQNIAAGATTFSGAGKIILTDAAHTIVGPVNARNLEIAPLTAARTVTLNTGMVTTTGTTALNGVSGNLISFGGTGNITPFTSNYCASNGGITNITCNAAPAPVTLNVISTADSGPGTLREALTNAAPGDTIHFTGAAPMNIVLTSPLPDVTGLTIDGTGKKVSIDANGTGRVFNVIGGDNLFRGLTLQGGNAGGTNTGGGINLTGGTAVVDKCTITGNTAYNGGGIFAGPSTTLTVTNSTIAGNAATKAGSTANVGGGIRVEGAVSVTNSTIALNTAPDNWGAGIRIGPTGSLVMKNSVVADNVTNTIHGGDDCWLDAVGPSVTTTNSIMEQGNSGCGGTAIDPQLGALADNGGDTFTMMPAGTSPAVNTGNAATCLSDDQRGKTRPATGTVCDMGAVEYSAPGVPATVAAALVGGVPQVTWGAPATGGAPTGYKVKRGTSASGPFTQIGTDTASPYDDATAVCGTTYYYVVVATNADGDSVESAPSAGVTPPCAVVVPGAPGALTFSAITQTAGQSNWTAPTTGGTPTGYNIYVDGTLVAGPQAGTSYNHTGLTCGTSYTVTVKAVNAGGEGAASSGTLTTAACPVAAVVTPRSPNSLLVDWPDSPTAVRYEVFRDGVLVGTVAAPTSQYLDTGLTPETQYQYDIVAYDSAGSASTVATATGTTAAAAMGSARPVPTLSEWAMILLSALLVLMGMARRGGFAMRG